MRDVRLRLRVGDVADPAQVREEVLGPVLRGLAGRLATMDQMAAGAVLTRAADVARRALALSDRLARQVGRWAAHQARWLAVIEPSMAA